MGVQVPHRVESGVSEKNYLQPMTWGYTAVYPRPVFKWKGVEITNVGRA